MQKPSCKNTPQYPASCCSPIGQNNTKDFSAQSGGSIGRAVWKWSGKSRFPGAFFALLVNIRRFISLPDIFSLAPTNCPWVSEDGLSLTYTGFSILCAYVAVFVVSNTVMLDRLLRFDKPTRQLSVLVGVTKQGRILVLSVIAGKSRLNPFQTGWGDWNHHHAN